MKEKEQKITISLTDKDLKKLEEKYECNREILNTALEYALQQFEEHVFRQLLALDRDGVVDSEWNCSHDGKGTKSSAQASDK